jgi:hypothetical protein
MPEKAGYAAFHAVINLILVLPGKKARSFMAGHFTFQ